ncbi:hypothetical protein K2Y00_00250 [Patescibacteria group bacterium]|nr:hypothetical protein [Patescibacteria group bacterium]
MIVIDIEATGVNPQKNSIVSLGALDLDNPENQFYDECRVWEGAHVETKALAVNGFSEEEIADPTKKTEAELVKAFIAWAMDRVEERTIAAQNVSFDHDMLRMACQRAGIEFPFAKRTIDVHTLVWTHMKVKGKIPPVAHNHSAIDMTYALSYCGLPPEPRPHNALTGAFCHAEVISRIAYNRKLLPDFDTYDIPWMS